MGPGRPTVAAFWTPSGPRRGTPALGAMPLSDGRDTAHLGAIGLCEGELNLMRRPAARQKEGGTLCAAPLACSDLHLCLLLYRKAINCDSVNRCF